jgi:hypothetical protein
MIYHRGRTYFTRPFVLYPAFIALRLHFLCIELCAHVVEQGGHWSLDGFSMFRSCAFFVLTVSSLHTRNEERYAILIIRSIQFLFSLCVIIFFCRTIFLALLSIFILTLPNLTAQLLGRKD